MVYVCVCVSGVSPGFVLGNFCGLFQAYLGTVLSMHPFQPYRYYQQCFSLGLTFSLRSAFMP